MYLCANNEKQVQICIDDRNLLNNRYYMYFHVFYREHRFIVFIAFLLFEHFIIYLVGMFLTVLIYEKVILQVVGSN